MSAARSIDPTDDRSDAREHLEDCLVELREAHDAVDVAASHAATTLDTHQVDGVVAALETAMHDRLKAATLVGLAILQWEEAGGHVALTDKVVPIPETVDLIEGYEELKDALEPVPGTGPQPAEPAAEDDLAELADDVDERPWEPEEKPGPNPDNAQLISGPTPTPAPPASPDALAALQTHFGNGGKPAPELIREAMTLAGPPVEVADMEEFTREASGLARLTLDLDPWLKLPRGAQKALTGLVAARARYLQDEAAPRLNHPVTLSVLGPVFPNLTRFSREHTPGFVFGLQRHHHPRGNSWLDDARDWWGDLQQRAGTADAADPEPKLNPERCLADLDGVLEADEPQREEVCAAAVLCLKAGVSGNDIRLVKMLHPHAKLLTKERRLKATRKAIREYARAMEFDGRDAEKDTSALPADWPFWKHTRGKRMVIVGGDPRPGALERIQTTFGFADGDWDSAYSTTRLDALAAQIENGNVDMIIFLCRWVSHMAWDIIVPACKAADIPFLRIESGYGVSQIRVSIEASLGSK